ncbi:MAG TPA: NlpC/P60 family protein [Allosphingosinicella sp.]|nr:NlpC/P60 family protein [Allosphingosinicella sp.]
MQAHGESSSRTDEWFHLTGPSLTLDPRIHAYRDDIADIGLAGQIFAPHYARPVVRGCGSRQALVRPAPVADSDSVTELLPGEDFAVLEYAGGWAWGYCLGDHVTGYVEAITLAERIEPTHIVCEKCAPVTPDGRITSTVIAYLPMGSRLHGREQGACLTTEYGCVSMSHLRPIGDHEADAVLVAERLLGAPYRPGGRSMEGIDAPGLIQLALGLAGLPAPHLIDQQRRLGAAVRDGAPSRRGDLVLSEAGGGLMLDDLLMIHASRDAGKVCVQPAAALAGAIRRRL